MDGLIHIYTGDGKGKTTAALGLAIRAAGAGKRVLFTQFLKGDGSSEIKVLKTIENIETAHCNTVRGFWKNLSNEQKAQAKEDYSNFFASVISRAINYDLLILDEIISACNRGAVAETELVDFLRNKPDKLEVVLTGRDASEELLALADYVSEMRKIKHPFDQGIRARSGIEF